MPVAFRDSLQALAHAANGQHFGADVQISRVSIDTRTLAPGDLYVAIRGERFDGHSYIDQAMHARAAGVVVEQRLESGVPQIVVGDTRRALAALGRHRLQRSAAQVVAITGSSGKTTVKEMIAAILAGVGPVHATPGNFNNDIGVPLTLLGLQDGHDFAVVEMGANHVGEIAVLSRMVSPDVAVVNNIGPAHLEGFGSLEATAGAKAEIYQGLAADGWAVINVDDAYAEVLRAAAGHCHRREFGIDTVRAPVRGWYSEEGFAVRSRGQELHPELALPGRHNAMNALAAIAATECLDVSSDIILAGLARVQAITGRQQYRKVGTGDTVIDDSYNANPASMLSAIEVLANCSGRRVLVIGDMLELGEEAVAAHHRAGVQAREAGIDELWVLGPLATHAARAFGSERVFDTHSALSAALQPTLDGHGTVLVKGSRGSRMERIVEALL